MLVEAIFAFAPLDNQMVHAAILHTVHVCTGARLQCVREAPALPKAKAEKGSYSPQGKAP